MSSPRLHFRCLLLAFPGTLSVLPCGFRLHSLLSRTLLMLILMKFWRQLFSPERPKWTSRGLVQKLCVGRHDPGGQRLSLQAEEAARCPPSCPGLHPSRGLCLSAVLRGSQSLPLPTPLHCSFSSPKRAMEAARGPAAGPFLSRADQTFPGPAPPPEEGRCCPPVPCRPLPPQASTFISVLCFF